MSAMKRTGIEGWSFYPTDAQGLHDAILSAPTFHNVSEAAHFAHSAVIVLQQQQQQIEALQASLRHLERFLGVSLEQPLVSPSITDLVIDVPRPGRE